jgi:hypothetical protein
MPTTLPCHPFCDLSETRGRDVHVWKFADAEEREARILGLRFDHEGFCDELLVC